MGNIGWFQLLIVLVIVLLLFGSKKLRGLGSDLGNAVKGFRGAMGEGEKEEAKSQERTKLDQDEEGHVIDGEATSNKDETKV